MSGDTLFITALLEKEKTKNVELTNKLNSLEQRHQMLQANAQKQREDLKRLQEVSEENEKLKSKLSRFRQTVTDMDLHMKKQIETIAARDAEIAKLTGVGSLETMAGLQTALQAAEMGKQEALRKLGEEQAANEKLDQELKQRTRAHSDSLLMINQLKNKGHSSASSSAMPPAAPNDASASAASSPQPPATEATEEEAEDLIVVENPQSSSPVSTAAVPSASSSPPLPSQPSLPTATTTNGKGDRSDSCSDDDDSDCDIAILGKTVSEQNVHARPDCLECQYPVEFAFPGKFITYYKQEDREALMLKAELKCNKCYCTVCEIPASKCTQWGYGEGEHCLVSREISSHRNVLVGNTRITPYLRITVLNAMKARAKKEQLTDIMQLALAIWWLRLWPLGSGPLKEYAQYVIFLVRYTNNNGMGLPTYNGLERVDLNLLLLCIFMATPSLIPDGLRSYLANSSMLPTLGTMKTALLNYPNAPLGSGEIILLVCRSLRSTTVPRTVTSTGVDCSEIHTQDLHDMWTFLRDHRGASTGPGLSVSVGQRLLLAVTSDTPLVQGDNQILDFIRIYILALIFAPPTDTSRVMTAVAAALCKKPNFSNAWKLAALKAIKQSVSAYMTQIQRTAELAILLPMDVDALLNDAIAKFPKSTASKPSGSNMKQTHNFGYEEDRGSGDDDDDDDDDQPAPSSSHKRKKTTTTSKPRKSTKTYKKSKTR